MSRGSRGSPPSGRKTEAPQDATPSDRGKTARNLAAIRKIACLEDLQAALREMSLDLRFEKFAYFICCPTSPAVKSVLLTDIPGRWCACHDDGRNFAACPLIDHCRRNLRPLAWTVAGFGNVHPDSFLRSAANAGLKSGVTVPMHMAHAGWGFLSLCTSQASSSSPDDIEATYVLYACHLGDATAHILMADGDLSLTERERECLWWCSEGKTGWEISKILGISERTVVFHLQNAVRKTKSSNRAQAIFRASPYLWD